MWRPERIPRSILALALWTCSISGAAQAPQGLEVNEETEFKLLLTEEGYKSLRRHFDMSGPADTQVQRNYYFDTEGPEAHRFCLKKNGVSVRLRTLGNLATLTVKIRDRDPSSELAPSRDPHALSTRVEYECSSEAGPATVRRIVSGELSLFDACEPWGRTEKSPAHPLAVLDARLSRPFHAEDGEAVSLRKKDLVLVGQNETLRSTVRTNLGGVPVLVELDRTLFPGDYVGYELEAEVEDAEGLAFVERDLRRLFLGLHLPYKPSQAGKTSITCMLLEKDPEVLGELLQYGSIQPAGSTETMHDPVTPSSARRRVTVGSQGASRAGNGG